MNKKIRTILIVVAVIAGLLMAVHMLVNNLHIVDALRRMHGG